MEMVCGRLRCGRPFATRHLPPTFDIGVCQQKPAGLEDHYPVPAPVDLTPSQTLFMRTAEDFSSTSETGPRMSASSHQPTSLGLEAYSLQISRRLDVRHRARWEGLW